MVHIEGKTDVRWLPRYTRHLGNATQYTRVILALNYLRIIEKWLTCWDCCCAGMRVPKHLDISTHACVKTTSEELKR